MPVTIDTSALDRGLLWAAFYALSLLGWIGLLILALDHPSTPPFGALACLSRCRSPLTFLLGRWRAGVSGAFRLGLAHGAVASVAAGR
jgi:hypothetical protein